MPNLFAKASHRHPLAKPIKEDIPNPFQQRLYAFRRRCRMGRRVPVTVTPKDEAKES